jgi:hypothetical protein
MRRLIVLVLALAVLALPSSVAAGGRPFVVQLSGEVEVPPGDPDGSGTAWLTLNPGTGEVCWTIVVEDIMLPAWGAHIHEAPAGEAGPVVIGLTAPDETGSVSGCTTADREEILEIILEPDEYYVNVHNDEYPDGAVRGQLSR